MANSPCEHDAIQTREDLSAFLKADLKAHGLTRWKLEYALTKPTVYYQRVLRRTEYFGARSDSSWARAALILSRLHLSRLSQRLGISIPPGVFGRGLSIAHYGSIIVHDEARVGKYCRIHSATNIGAGKEGTPTLGDFVYVAPGAVISGGIFIGSRVAVAANSVVLASVAEGSTVVGAPGRALYNRGSRSVMPEWIQEVMDMGEND